MESSGSEKEGHPQFMLTLNTSGYVPVNICRTVESWNFNIKGNLRFLCLTNSPNSTLVSLNHFFNSADCILWINLASICYCSHLCFKRFSWDLISRGSKISLKENTAWNEYRMCELGLGNICWQKFFLPRGQEDWVQRKLFFFNKIWPKVEKIFWVWIIIHELISM